MKITKDTVVSMHYNLTNSEGTQLDSSAGGDPLVFLQGHHNIIPGLEQEMDGKEKGDKFTATIAPAMAYGERDDNLIQAIPRSNFPEGEIAPGMAFNAETPQGMMQFTVTSVADTEVTVDANHPLAGMTLQFEVEVVDVRAATADEVAHGHAHGPGGHHHG